MYFWEALAQKEEAEEKLNAIPLATLGKITQVVSEDGGSILKEPSKFRAIIVEGKMVGTVTDKYKLVQHKDAFKPVIDGLNAIGADFNLNVYHTDRKAWMNILTTESKDSKSLIKVGFNVLNSVEGSTAIRYSFSSSAHTKIVELVGWRQTCSNGMKIRVPLENAEIVTIEEREKIEHIFSTYGSIMHMGDKIEEKIKAVQYVVEAMELLKNPVERIIKKAEALEVGRHEAKALIRKYIGKRHSSEIEAAFDGAKDNSLWGIYNAVTYVASHGLKTSQMNTMLDRGADLLEGEIRVRA